ncbi:unnamed protein product [Closterium sp. Naga37s-1]|nr:unnamed protein product [Closterium sp. Naga37s-1]
MSRAVYCGNFEYEARQSEHICPIPGFAFVYMDDERDGDDAIRALDGMEFGRQRRRLRVEWARGEGPVKQREPFTTSPRSQPHSQQKPQQEPKC